MLRPYRPLVLFVAEAWVVLIAIASIAILLLRSGADLLALLAVLLAGALIFLFADTDRDVNCKSRDILAPLDGTVIQRRECHDPILAREAIRIVLRVSPFGGYCLRAPVEAEVISIPDGEGPNRASRLLSDEGEDVILRVVRGALFGSAPVLTPLGERVGQGRRCGLRRLARELEILVPAGVRVEVAVGQKVRSGQTVLATLLRKPH